MRNTEYNSRLIEPDLAPTIKSVPEIVLAKLFLASVLIRSIASNKQTDKAIAKIVNNAVNNLLRKLAKAKKKINTY